MEEEVEAWPFFDNRAERKRNANFAVTHCYGWPPVYFPPVSVASLLHLDRVMPAGLGQTSTVANECPPLPRRQWYRWLFIVAGIYNVGWGIYAAADPQWLFRFAKMPLQNHPQIFACLGMVVGLYGILYLEVARVPERGWLLAFVGLVGKILGPIGLIQLLVQGVWPLATLVLCLTNDFIWWLPFYLYLRAAWPYFRDSLRAS